MALNPSPASRREAWGRRVLALAVVTAIGFVGLVGQLWYLQVLEGGRMQELSEKNRIRVRPVAAPRGILFDRNGLALVDNRPAFTLSLIPREMEDRNSVVARLAVLLKMPVGDLMDALERVPADSIRPVRVRRGLSLEDVTKVEERKLELPGVIVEVEPQRVYPTSTFAAHLLGYVREVSDEQMKQGRYRRGDMIGQSGLERLLDEYLRGRDGGERIEVDALGRPVQVMRREEPDPGAQVVTTIDRRIQEVAEQHDGGQGRLGGGHGSAQRRRAGSDVEPRVPPRSPHREHRPRRVAASGEGPDDPAHEPRPAGAVPARLGIQDHRGRGRSPGGLARPDGPDLLQRGVQPGSLDVQGLEGGRARPRGSAHRRRPVVRRLLLPGRPQGRRRHDGAVRAGLRPRRADRHRSGRRAIRARAVRGRPRREASARGSPATP